MKIVNHKLEGCWYGQTPNHGGALTNPTLLVMHFTSSGPTEKGDADFFLSSAAKAAAHIIVGRTGHVLQVAPFNQKAWHAGRSIWRGRANCNDYSIGIEVDNWGKVFKSGDGEFRAWSKKELDPADVAYLQHKHETSKAWWEIYPEEQMQALTEVTRLILEAYPSIKEIAGHDDIAPGRKIDPGPAFNMSRFQSLVSGRGDHDVVNRRTLANVNARGGPGLQYDVNRVIPKGALISVVYEEFNGWAQLTTGEWVNDNYLSQTV